MHDCRMHQALGSKQPRCEGRIPSFIACGCSSQCRKQLSCGPVCRCRRRCRHRLLLPLLAPQRHHSAAGLLATRLFNELFN